ncbi:lipopolysaccharide biosynthesis protein [Candidatus Saccharibacteria bacterium]|nr:lipopolysaccharide biosynthesis protein [Candidatus Saccharibacteria bacterium]
MAEGVKQKVVSNLAWRFAERTGAQVVQFVVSIVLARILAPEAYGTIALVTVFITILQVFVDSGLGSALIQKKNVDSLDFSTVFYANIALCVVLYIILFLSAPLIADFYNDPSLIAITRVLGLTVIVSGIKNVQQAYVSRHLIFKKFFFSTLAGTIGAAVIGITMAYNGFGVWALVAQMLFNLTLDTIVLWITVKWRPTLQFSFKRLGSLFSFGWKLLVSSVINATYQNIRQLLIGKIYSATDLALFNRGKQFPNIIVENINKSIDSVLFPTLSNEQEDKRRVKVMTRRAIKTSIFIIAPLMMGLAFASTNIVRLLLTDKWLGCVPFLCVFSVTFMFYPLHTANLNAIKAKGRSDLFLGLEVIKTVIDVVLLLISIRFGVIAIAVSLLISSFTSQIINSWPNKKLIDYGYLEQLKDMAPSILLAVVMGLVILPLNFIEGPLLLLTLTQILIGAVIYIVGAKVLKFEMFDYILGIVGERVGKR